MSRTIKVIAWIIAALGLWEAGDIVAPLVPGFGQVPAYLWNHVAVGIILMVAGAWTALTRHARTAKTLTALAAAAGAWLIIATFILRSPAPAAGRWNDLAVGAAVLVLAATARIAMR